MKSILGIDTETTGLTRDDCIVQLALVRLNPLTFETEERYGTLVYTDVPVHPKAQAVHGISPEMLAGAPSWEEVLRDSPLLPWLESADIILGHNVGFDLRMLGVPKEDPRPRLDTWHICRSLFPGWRNHKLQTCVAELGLPQRQAHDALGDIESSADIVRYLHRQYGMDLDAALDAPNLLKRLYIRRFGQTKK
ncbi:3'-5' exonuclease [Neisseria leonii]|uniref:3'-5' exonuclease n=1 Tax=Neisseria leonii TaxID=2995413 RepID=A0A9X4E2G3_9NEIS|nr:3'-5' exonuclease [Neisseria sp. 51.81]MDD9328233.1 3'-5' exonuclease [Neisseria sp. 51.81]